MPSLIKEFGLIALLTVLGAGFSLISGIAPWPGAEPELAPGAIRLADAEGLDPIWVDARSRAEFDAGHAPEAIWLNEESWDSGIVALMERWLRRPRPIIVYCSSASCGTSRAVAERLRDDLENAEIYTLHGGWDAWKW